MTWQTATRFAPALLLVLAAPSAAQEEACSMEASVSAEPVVPVPADAPVFAPLSWTMTRDQIRRALTADGWRRDASRTEAGVDWFDGQLFGRPAILNIQRGSTGRLNRVVLFVRQDQDVSWDRSLWDAVSSVLTEGYGPPRLTRNAEPRAYGGPVYCSSFETRGDERVSAAWPTLFATMVASCEVAVFYDGPGRPESVRAELISDARAADRTCRAEMARLERDRNRLAPGVAARPLPPRTARLPPAAGQSESGPERILDFADVQPVLIGGVEQLHSRIDYPDYERRAGIEGRVIVTFVVRENGVPSDVAVFQAVSEGLDAAAIRAVQQARFTPGRQDGRPVAVRFTLPVTFRIR